MKASHVVPSIKIISPVKNLSKLLTTSLVMFSVTSLTTWLSDGIAHAATLKQTTPANNSQANASTNKAQLESEAMNQTLANVFKAMSRSSVDFSFDGAVIQAADPEQDAKTEINRLDSQAYFSFSSEIVQDLLSAAPNKKQSEAELQLIPKLHLATQNMLVVFDYQNEHGNQKVRVDFYNAKKPDRNKPVPLQVTVANQLNNSLIALRLYSIDLTLTRDPRSSNRLLVNGQCQSDKTVFDFFSNSEKTKEMLCQFKGFYEIADSKPTTSNRDDKASNKDANHDTYNITIKYVDKPIEKSPAARPDKDPKSAVDKTPSPRP